MISDEDSVIKIDLTNIIHLKFGFKKTYLINWINVSTESVCKMVDDTL